MEVASKNTAPVSYENAFLLEKQGELTKASAMYDKLLKKAPEDLEVLSRGMIVSRKLKNYKQEITYINKAIKIHEAKYAKLKTDNRKVANLSRQLNKLLGHTDQKGKNLLAIPEVETLKKRKETVSKKIR